MRFDYPVELTRDGDTWQVTFPDIPEAITLGEGRDVALQQAKNTLETAKVGIYAALMEQGLRKAVLTRRLHWHMPQVPVTLYQLSIPISSSSRPPSISMFEVG